MRLISVSMSIYSHRPIIPMLDEPVLREFMINRFQTNKIFLGTAAVFRYRDPQLQNT